MPHDEFLSGQTLKAGELSIPAASVYRDSNQSIPDNVFTRVDYTQVLYDHGSNFDVPNSRFVAPRAGLIQASFLALWDRPGIVADSNKAGAVFKNGVFYKETSQNPFESTGEWFTEWGTATVEVVTNDFVEIHVFQNTGGTMEIFGSREQQWAEFNYIGVGG